MNIVLVLLGGLVLGIYCLACGILALQQRRILYVPDRHRPDLPAAGIARAQAVTVRTSDGLDLLAWYAPAADTMKPVVLYLHGNGGHIGYRGPRLARLSGFGWGVMLLEYRGFGGNPGTPTEAGLYEDARAGYASLRASGVEAGRIVLWGESLGTGVAVRLASEQPVGAVLLESPYTTITAIGQQRFPFVPVGLLLRDRFDLVGRIGTVRAPVLVMTGGRDDVIPPSMGRAVFAAANEPKQFWLAPQAGHNDLGEAGALEVVRDFVGARWRMDRQDAPRVSR